jgi:methylenetetrahydrofolate dehydrogenase (NADP+)/methenyltetrahydrofolate cyclohydrolase
MKAQVERLAAAGCRPGLAVLLVGEDPASQVYVRNKVKACESVGMHSLLERLPATLGEAELLARIDQLNADPAVHGILVQLPLPPAPRRGPVIEPSHPPRTSTASTSPAPAR